MMYPNNLSFYIRMGIKFGNWKDDIWLRHHLNRIYWCDIPYHTVYYIQYIVSFLYLSISGTSTKLDKDMDDWRSLIVLIITIWMKSPSLFKLKGSRIFSSAISSWLSVSFELHLRLKKVDTWLSGQEKSEKPYTFSVIFKIRWYFFTER